MRVSVGHSVGLAVTLAVAVFACAVSLNGAAAQAYPPSPRYPSNGGYYPPPPANYDDYSEGWGPYGEGPVPPADVGTPGPGYGRSYQSGPMPPAYVAPRAPYAAASPPSPYYGSADPDTPRPPGAIGGSADVTGSLPDRPPAAVPGGRSTMVAGLPPEDQPEAAPANLPADLRKQLVDYATTEPAGTVIIDTPHTYLYLVLGRGKAMRYGIGVGREGFTWSGTERVSRMSQWPDWHPPKEMIERQPYLPRFMAGGEGNPLGARALYLGNTVYRIHGTNQPSTIGHTVSSGCIRLTNEDVEDLYSRVNVGTRVVVLPGAPPVTAAMPTDAAH